MAIAFDSASNSGYQTGSTYSWSHTTGGAEKYLVVGVSMLSVAASSVTGITYNGVALSSLGNATSGTGTVRIELWGLANPTVGANTIAVTLSAALDSSAGASSYTGVNQGSPTEAFNSASATNVGAADATVNITTVADNDWVVDVVATDDTAITVGAGQTSRSNVTGTLGSGATSSEGPKTPAGAVTMSWTNVGALATWTIGGIALKESGSSSSSSSSCRSSSSSSSLSCQFNQWSVASACVAQWKMDEASWNGTASEVVDSSGNGNHGTATGAVTTASGKISGAGSFDGVGDIINLGNPASLNISGNMTVTAWIKFSVSQTNKPLVARWGTDQSYLLWISTTANRLNFSIRVSNVSKAAATSNNYNDGLWHFVVGRFDGSNVLLNIDNNVEAIVGQATSGPIDTPSQNVSIGAYNDSTSPYNGLIDEVCIFNRALTQTEISGLYNFGIGTQDLSGCFSSSSCSSSSSSSSSCRSSSSSSSSCSSSSSSSCRSSSSSSSSSSSCRSSSSCSSSSSRSSSSSSISSSSRSSSSSCRSSSSSYSSSSSSSSRKPQVNFELETKYVI